MILFLRENEESGIPPDSKITYILELISIKQGPDIGSLTDEERIQLGYGNFFPV